MTRLQFILTLLAAIPGMKWVRRKEKCAFNVKILQDRIDYLNRHQGNPNDITPDERIFYRNSKGGLTELKKGKPGGIMQVIDGKRYLLFPDGTKVRIQ